MAAAIIPAAIAGISGISKLFGGIGGSSGTNPADNALRQNQLQSAEAAALQGDPQAAAELAAWNRPGPTNQEAQQFLAQNLGVLQEGQGTTFSGNYGQVFSNGLGGGTVQNPSQTTGEASGGASPSLAGLGSGTGSSGSSAGSALGGILNSAGQVAGTLQAAQNSANQTAQLNAARAAAQNAYAQKAGLRGMAIQGLTNSMNTTPNLSSDFRSSNPFANAAANPYSGIPGTAGISPLTMGNGNAPATTVAGGAIGPSSGALSPSSPQAVSGAQQPTGVPSLAGLVPISGNTSMATLSGIPGSVRSGIMI